MSDLLQRITSDPDIFNGKPIIRGHRLAVEHVLGMLAAGDTPEAIVAAYPGLEREDVDACVALDALIEQAETIARDKALQQCRETLAWIHFAARGDKPRTTLAEVAEQAGMAIDYAQRMLSRWDDDGKD